MDYLPGGAPAERSIAHSPVSAAGQRDVDLLGLVMVVGIDGLRTEHQHAPGNRAIGKMAACSEHLEPAIVRHEFRAEIGLGVGLAPGEPAAGRGKQLGEPAPRPGGDRSGRGKMLEAWQQARFDSALRHAPVHRADEGGDRLAFGRFEERADGCQQFVMSLRQSQISACRRLAPKTAAVCAAASLS
jgi:hypothetical protein